MFVTELRRLSEYCEFAATLYEMLRDSLVCRVRDSRIQRCLLAEPKLSFKRALDIAVALETAEKDALNLQKNPTPGGNATVNKFKGKAGDEKEPKPRHTSKCSRCDGNGTIPVHAVSKMPNVMLVGKLVTPPEPVAVRIRGPTSQHKRQGGKDYINLSQPIALRGREKRWRKTAP